MAFDLAFFVAQNQEYHALTPLLPFFRFPLSGN